MRPGGASERGRRAGGKRDVGIVRASGEREGHEDTWESGEEEEEDQEEEREGMKRRKERRSLKKGTRKRRGRKQREETLGREVGGRGKVKED